MLLREPNLKNKKVRKVKRKNVTEFIKLQGINRKELSFENPAQ